MAKVDGEFVLASETGIVATVKAILRRRVEGADIEIVVAMFQALMVNA